MNASEKPTRIPVAEIDLNADLGEGLLNDQALLGLVTSASICCGAHAGSSQAIRRTLCDAHDREVVIGAHPGYPDRDGFGRRDQDLSAEQVEILITGQVSALGSLARSRRLDSLSQTSWSALQPGPVPGADRPRGRCGSRCAQSTVTRPARCIGRGAML